MILEQSLSGQWGVASWAQPWVLITVAAAFAQNLRSLLQRNLTAVLTVHGATYVRFVYALPWAWLLVLWLQPSLGLDDLPWAFFAYACVGGAAQIMGTFCLVLAVSRGNFALGTGLSKTEAAQAAGFGLLVLGDLVTLNLGIGILLSFIGVCLLLSRQAGAGLTGEGIGMRTLAAGVAAGTGFAVSAVCFRGASVSLPGGEVLERAALTVTAALTFQTLVHGCYILWREPGQMSQIAKAWRTGAGVGLIGATASLGWFAAMTISSAAKVRAVGQIEMVFTLLTSSVLLGERLTLREVGGLVLILAGLALLL